MAMKLEFMLDIERFWLEWLDIFSPVSFKNKNLLWLSTYHLGLQIALKPKYV